MSQYPLISRVVLRHYKSITSCDVELGKLTWLVGRNGAGKSNFLDALHLVSDALNGSLESAINERGGLDSVRQRSAGHPKHFGIRLEFCLEDGQQGFYAFEVGSITGGAQFVKREECGLPGKRAGPYFLVRNGEIIDSSFDHRPSITNDRLALVVMSGFKDFQPVFDALASMDFYSLNPQRMRSLQKPQDSRSLKSEGENIASVLGRLERASPNEFGTIVDYLKAVAPMVAGVRRKALSNMETLEFRQAVKGDSRPWKFEGQNMSDGTLRALGILTALFQRSEDYAPLLVGLEEPETALHPAASAALREAIRRSSAERQVLITSHSTELLDDDGIAPEEVRAVVWQDGNTHIVPIDSVAADAMRDHLYSAGELLRQEQLSPSADELEASVTKTGDLFGSSE